MAAKTFSAWPQFREPDQAGVERVFRDVIRNAAIILVRGDHELFQVRSHVGQSFRREPQYTEDSYAWSHPGPELSN